jgi:peptide deformylase
LKFEYSTRDGRQVNAKLHGMLAIIFQHEFDHLDGLVYL